MPGNRSPNYPSISLGEAIDSARKLYKAEKRSAMTPEVAARSMGYNALHGPARSRIGSLRKYGLLDRTSDGLQLSEVAVTILFPPSDEEKAAALQAAALRPELFRELAALPGASDANLIGRLVRQGFTAAGAKTAVASFRATISLAPSGEEVYDSTESEEEELVEYTPPARDRKPSPPFDEQQIKGQSFVFPLANGVMVQLSVSGGTLSKQGMGMLRKYLDVVEDAVPDEKAEIAPSPAAAPTIVPEPPSEQSPDDAQE
jgi:hypothetical protein